MYLSKFGYSQHNALIWKTVFAGIFFPQFLLVDFRIFVLLCYHAEKLSFGNLNNSFVMDFSVLSGFKINVNVNCLFYFIFLLLCVTV